MRAHAASGELCEQAQYIRTLCLDAQCLRRTQLVESVGTELGFESPPAETMYILDLALDRRTADIPLRVVPWGRFEAVLKELNLE
jgi:hypothetical protein